MRVMKIQILNVRYHDFQIIQQRDNIILAKCNCCPKSRWAVFKAINSYRTFYYHGYDLQYAQKLFSSLISKSQIQ